MEMTTTNDILDLLIIGGGPVGLTAALEAKRLGLSVRIIDRKEKRSIHDSRAVVVHPRVMELLKPINGGDVTAGIEKTAFHPRGVCVYMKKWFGRKGEKGDGFDHMLLNLKTVEWGDTEFPNIYFLPQYETEHILEEALNSVGGQVEYDVALETLSQTDGIITSELKSNGSTETEIVTSKWVLGADGGRSKTRELVGIEMNRYRSDLYFIIADVVFQGNPPLDSHAPEKAGHIFPTDLGVIAMFPLPGENHYRLFGQAPEGIKNKDDLDMSKSFIEKYLFDRTGKKFDVELGPWQTVFEVTHGTSHSYRSGNVLLAGDASHVHR
jgi:2-polyprenyl-6-methoxyphenol hydroxylase-like FAD-dependent oxidoreductase